MLFINIYKPSIMKKIFYILIICILVQNLFLFSCNHTKNQKDTLNSLTLTSVSVANIKYDFGDITSGSTKEAIFTISNNGDVPFVIYQVTANCGCTKIEWEKQPIEPGKSTQVKVFFSSNSRGYFHKDVNIYGNITPTPLKLFVTGTVLD